MSSVNLELIHHLWIPNIFIYNLKTFKGKDDRPFSTALTSTISVGEMEEWVSIYWTSSYGFHTQSVVNSVQRQVAPETLVSWGLRKRQKVKIYTSKKLLWDIYIFFLGGGRGCTLFCRWRRAQIVCCVKSGFTRIRVLNLISICRDVCIGIVFVFSVN